LATLKHNQLIKLIGDGETWF